MAQLDVAEVLIDPLLATQFPVLRRTQTMGSNGVASITTLALSAIGVVTDSTPDDLDRKDDQQTMGRSLTIVTRFALRGPAPGYQPDIVVWAGDRFVISKVDPYPQFGRGFVQAEATSMDFIDVQPQTDLPAPGELVFIGPLQSGLIGIL